MNILIVSPYVPHPQSGHGGGVFMYHMIERLVLRHDVTLISFCDEREERFGDDLRNLKLKCHFLPRSKGTQNSAFSNIALAGRRAMQLVRSVFAWEPYYVSKFRDRRMERMIAEQTAKEAFDIVQIEYTQMARYVAFVKSGRTILHELDVSYRPAYRRFRKAKNPLVKIIHWAEWCRWASYEPAVGRRFDRLLAVTGQDRMLLDWLTGAGNARYFPHAVEPAEKLPRYDSREPHSVMFVGSYSHSPNVDAARWLCREIFPRVRATFPSAKLYIIGPQPPADLKHAAGPERGIIVTDFVEDVDEYHRRCSVFAAPLRFGGGIKNKVLYAMAQGVPVVSTRVGIEGVDGLEHGAVCVANDASSIADTICRLFSDTAFAEATGMRGWETIRRVYSWKSVIARLEDFYAEALGRERRG